MTLRARAILSVHDKRGIVDLARGLGALGLELVASGGTARALEAAGVPVTPISKLTRFPELLDGRVKTLHPVVHAGILARRTAEHLEQLARHGIAPVDVVVCNLYPFVEAAASAALPEAAAVELVDIGGVALLRAAAKNFESVTVLSDPASYPAALSALERGAQSLEDRRRLAVQAFRHTARHDEAIAHHLAALGQRTRADGARVTEAEHDRDSAARDELPPELVVRAVRAYELRYGENPHQRAALYRTAERWPFEPLQGRELSYNNIVDLDAAWAMVEEFDEPAVAIVKHANPCGLAVGPSAVDAYRAALDCDPVSAFGSIIACNREIDAGFVDALDKLFVEVVVAPSFRPDALEHLARGKKNCRVVRGSRAGPEPLVLRTVRGGLLCQSADALGIDEPSWRVVTRRAPDADERRALGFALVAVKHVKSNAIVLARGTATVGIGPGQTNRVDSVALAAKRAGPRASGAVLASDAFFPFPDGIEQAAAAGVTAVAQPGGSIRDGVVIEAADRAGMAMVLTGSRHFRH